MTYCPWQFMVSLQSALLVCRLILDLLCHQTNVLNRSWYIHSWSCFDIIRPTWFSLNLKISQKLTSDFNALAICHPCLPANLGPPVWRPCHGVKWMKGEENQAALSILFSLECWYYVYLCFLGQYKDTTVSQQNTNFKLLKRLLIIEFSLKV